MDLESGSSPAPSLKDDEQQPADDDKVALGSGSVSGLGPPSPIKKGFGLKKWRRIPRDVSKIGTSSNSSGKVGIEELPDPAPNPTKRGSSYAEMQRKSETSISPPADAGLSSENGEEQTINSPSSVTIGLKINYEIPLVVGSSHGKGKMRLGGKNSGKARIQTMKKHRGKETSQGSSSGVHSSSNGIQSHFNEENGDEVLGPTDQVGNGMDTEGGIFPGDEVTMSSSEVQNVSNENQTSHEDHDPPEVQNVSNENQTSHEDHDPLAEVMAELQTVQEALAKELFLLTEINKDAGESEPDTGSEWTDVGKELIGKQSFSQTVEVEVNSQVLETEGEDLFKKSVEAEVIYTVTSGAANELRSFSLIQATATENQKNHVAADTRTVLSEPMKVEKISEDISIPEVTWKSRKTLWKLASYAFIQLLLLLVIILELVPRFSSSDGNIAPT